MLYLNWLRIHFFCIGGNVDDIICTFCLKKKNLCLRRPPECAVISGDVVALDVCLRVRTAGPVSRDARVTNETQSALLTVDVLLGSCRDRSSRLSRRPTWETWRPTSKVPGAKSPASPATFPDLRAIPTSCAWLRGRAATWRRARGSWPISCSTKHTWVWTRDHDRNGDHARTVIDLGLGIDCRS